MSGKPGRPHRVETVLLDAGGVLLDLDYRYIRRLLEARHNVVSEDVLARAEALARVDVDRWVRAGGRPAEAWRDYFRVLLGHAAVPPEVREPIIDTLWDAHQRFGVWTVPVAGASEALRELKRLGFRLGVVSNAEGRVQRDLEAAGYDGVFETVVDSHLVGVEKPDPGIFRIAIEQMRASAETCVFLGDVPAVDVEGARAAGIAPILLDRFDLYGAVEVPRLRSIGELPGWLTS